MKLSLRARYALILASITVVVVAAVESGDVYEALTYQRDVRAKSSEAMSAGLMREVESSGLGLAGMLAASLIEPVFQENFDEIANIARAATGLPYVKRALVYDRSATVIHDGTDEILAYGTPGSEVLQASVLGRGEVVVERDLEGVQILHPIKIGDRVLGGVALTITLDDALSDIAYLNRELNAINEESVRRQIRKSLLFGGAMCVLGIVLGVLIAERLSRPIRQLTALASKIGQREYRFDLPFRRGDELGELATGLQSMARSLEESTVSHAQLETKIAERTAQLSAANRQLKRQDQNRQRFFAEVSHELKTPLTVIRGEADVLLRNDGESVAEYRHGLRRINEQTRQLSRLVRDLLDLAYAEADDFRFQEADVDLTAVVRDSCDDATVIAGTSGVTIRSDVDQEALIVRGDNQRLRQLCLALMDNAINHSDPDSAVSVSCHEENGMAKLVMADQGVGMSESELEHVFDRFYRTADANRRVPGGTGLGLTIAKTIVDAHDGKISVESETGRGTRVTVRLPLTLPQASATAEAP